MVGRPAALPEVRVEDIEEDLRALGTIGRRPDAPGVHRLGFSDEDLLARRWLMGRIEEAGGAASMDPAGNVLGRWFGEQPGPAVLMGSHLDSVAAGGDFDGPLGVIAGLECVRAIRRGAITPARPIEVIAFADEEGRFGGMFGSEALTGGVDAERVRTAVDAHGVRLVDRFEAWGLDPNQISTAARTPESLHAFLELHIEQGPVLEAEGLSLGVVEGISGIFKWMIRLLGRANHAGTTPMDMRQDAFMGMVDFAHSFSEILEEVGTPTSRLTIGQAEVKPGYPHTVPGEVAFTLVGRDLDEEVMRRISERCRERLEVCAGARGLRSEVESLSWLSPSVCHPEIVEAFARQATQRGVPFRRMVSGAGHDTQFMTQVTRAGLLFVPSIGGISHAPEEAIRWEDVRVGTEVLLHTLLELTS